VASQRRPALEGLGMGAADSPQDFVPRWLQSIAEANKLNKVAAGDSDLLNSLVLRLSHANSTVRHLAAKCLATKAAKGDERVLGALLNLAPGSEGRGADDPDHDVRVAAIDSAGSIAEGTRNDAVSGRLIALLEERDWSVREAAVKALVKVGCTDEGALVDRLCSLMESNKWWAKAMAAEALGKLCQVADDKVVGALVSVMKDQDWAVRKTATKALGWIAPTKSEAVTAIMGRLADSDWRVRKTAVETVGLVYTPGSDALLDAILDRLEDARLPSCKTTLDVVSKGDRDVKTATIVCLAALARHREPRVLDALQGLQQTAPDATVRAKVDEALAKYSN